MESKETSQVTPLPNPHVENIFGFSVPYMNIVSATSPLPISFHIFGSWDWMVTRAVMKLAIATALRHGESNSSWSDGVYKSRLTRI